MNNRLKKALILMVGGFMLSGFGITPSFASINRISGYISEDKYPSEGDWEDGERIKEQNKISQNGVSSIDENENSAQKTTVKYTGITYTHNKRFDKCSVVNGIDVSKWNGDINWNKVKKDGIEFAFIRVGYRGYESGGLYEDELYEENIKEATAAGIKVGVYIYSQATTVAEAREEANYILKRIKKYKITMPVVFDFEYFDGPSGRLWDANLSKSEATKICKAFCKVVEDAGYEAMQYSNPSMLYNSVNASEIEKDYKIWLAHWGIDKTSYEGLYDYWQYGSGYVDGVSGAVDVNFWYNPKKSTGITLSATSKTMKVGDKIKLTGKIIPEESTDIITWSSSNPVAAYVDQNGNVVAGNRGTVTITATTTSGVKATCKITVNDNISNFEAVLKDGVNPIYSGKAHTPKIILRSKEKVVLSGTVNTAVNLRTGPSTDYPIITTMPVGASVAVYKSFTDADGDIWYSARVTLDGKTYRGYCSAPYINAKKDYREISASYYTVAYSNNINAGNAVLTISPTSGSYFTGSLVTGFVIEGRDIVEAIIEPLDDYVYTGSVITPDIEAEYSDMTLVKDKDYTLAYSNNVGSGVAEITVNGIGNYKGSVIKTFEILGNRSYYIEGIGQQLYTGEALKPNIIIRDKNTNAVIDNSNFVIQYSNNKNIGVASISIKGKGAYEGNITINFEIVSEITSTNIITVYNIDNFEYTGNEVRPVPIVMCNGKEVSSDAYSIEYYENVTSGTALMKVIAKEGYTGSYLISYKILRSDITSDSYSVNNVADVVYTGKLITPQIILANSEYMLAKDVDYIVEYQNNLNAGKATIIIKGIGNYKGKITVSFNITSKSIIGLEYVNVPSQIYQAKVITPTLIIKDGEYTLVKGKDYNLTYSSNVNVGAAKITVNGAGNYKGTVNKTFVIQARGLASCKSSKISDKTYTGKAITPAVTVKYGSYKLVLNKDYTIVKYSANKNIGTASIILKGKGNFTGNMTVTFNIVPKKVQSVKASNITSSQIKLSWKNDPFVTGYEIYRSKAYNGSYTKIRTITNNKNATYTNKGLLNGREYYYKIRAYKIINGKTYYGKFSSIRSVSTKDRYTKYVKMNETAYIRSRADKNSKALIKVKKGKEMTYLSTAYDSANVKWYKVRYKYKSKTYTGYVRNDKANVESLGKVKADILNVRKSASTTSKKVNSIKEDKKVRILKTIKDSKGSKWYQIRFTKGGKTYTGYVMAKYIKVI